jgi:biotin carboxyl carrier protein
MTAARSGRVSAVHIHPGDRIDRGAPLIQVE